MGKSKDKKRILSSSSSVSENGTSSEEANGVRGPYKESTGRESSANKHSALEANSSTETEPDEKSKQNQDTMTSASQKEHRSGSESARDRKNKIKHGGRDSRAERLTSRERKKREEKKQKKMQRDKERRTTDRIAWAQLLCGAVCGVLGGGSYTTNADAVYIQAFVAGGLLILAGLFGLIAGRVKSRCIQRSYVYTSLVALVLGAVSLLLSGLVVMSIDLSRASHTVAFDSTFRTRLIIYSLAVAASLLGGCACVYGLWDGCHKAYPRKRETGVYLEKNMDIVLNKYEIAKDDNAKKIEKSTSGAKPGSSEENKAKDKKQDKNKKGKDSSKKNAPAPPGNNRSNPNNTVTDKTDKAGKQHGLNADQSNNANTSNQVPQRLAGVTPNTNAVLLTTANNNRSRKGPSPTVNPQPAKQISPDHTAMQRTPMNNAPKNQTPVKTQNAKPVAVNAAHVNRARNTATPVVHGATQASPANQSANRNVSTVPNNANQCGVHSQVSTSPGNLSAVTQVVGRPYQAPPKTNNTAAPTQRSAYPPGHQVPGQSVPINTSHANQVAGTTQNPPVYANQAPSTRQPPGKPVNAAQPQYQPSVPQPQYQPSVPQPQYQPSVPQPQYQPSVPQPKYQPSVPQPKYQPSVPQPQYQPSVPQPQYQPSVPQPQYQPSVPQPKYQPSVPQPKYQPSVPQPQYQPSAPRQAVGGQSMPPKQAPITASTGNRTVNNTSANITPTNQVHVNSGSTGQVPNYPNTMGQVHANSAPVRPSAAAAVGQANITPTAAHVYQANTPASNPKVPVQQSPQNHAPSNEASMHQAQNAARMNQAPYQAHGVQAPMNHHPSNQAPVAHAPRTAPVAQAPIHVAGNQVPSNISYSYQAPTNTSSGAPSAYTTSANQVAPSVAALQQHNPPNTTAYQIGFNTMPATPSAAHTYQAHSASQPPNPAVVYLAPPSQELMHQTSNSTPVYQSPAALAQAAPNPALVYHLSNPTPVNQSSNPLPVNQNSNIAPVYQSNVNPTHENQASTPIPAIQAPTPSTVYQHPGNPTPGHQGSVNPTPVYQSSGNPTHGNPGSVNPTPVYQSPANPTPVYQTPGNPTHGNPGSVNPTTAYQETGIPAPLYQPPANTTPVNQGTAIPIPQHAGPAEYQGTTNPASTLQAAQQARSPPPPASPALVYHIPGTQPASQGPPHPAAAPLNQAPPATSAPTHYAPEPAPVTVYQPTSAAGYVNPENQTNFDPVLHTSDNAAPVAEASYTVLPNQAPSNPAHVDQSPQNFVLENQLSTNLELQTHMGSSSVYDSSANLPPSPEVPAPVHTDHPDQNSVPGYQFSPNAEAVFQEPTTSPMTESTPNLSPSTVVPPDQEYTIHSPEDPATASSDQEGLDQNWIIKAPEENQSQEGNQAEGVISAPLIPVDTVKSNPLLDDLSDEEPEVIGSTANYLVARRESSPVTERKSRSSPNRGRIARALGGNPDRSPRVKRYSPSRDRYSPITTQQIKRYSPQFTQPGRRHSPLLFEGRNVSRSHSLNRSGSPIRLTVKRTSPVPSGHHHVHTMPRPVVTVPEPLGGSARSAFNSFSRRAPSPVVRDQQIMIVPDTRIAKISPGHGREPVYLVPESRMMSRPSAVPAYQPDYLYDEPVYQYAIDEPRMQPAKIKVTTHSGSSTLPLRMKVSPSGTGTHRSRPHRERPIIVTTDRHIRNVRRAPSYQDRPYILAPERPVTMVMPEPDIYTHSPRMARYVPVMQDPYAMAPPMYIDDYPQPHGYMAYDAAPHTRQYMTVHDSRA